MLFPRPGQLKKREEAEGVPVHIIVWVELGFLASRSVSRAVREAQMIGNLPMEKSKQCQATQNTVLIETVLVINEIFYVFSKEKDEFALCCFPIKNVY